MALNEGQSFIQYVVDVETLSRASSKKGDSGNHPDADVINAIIEARKGRARNTTSYFRRTRRIPNWWSPIPWYL